MASTHSHHRLVREEGNEKGECTPAFRRVAEALRASLSLISSEPESSYLATSSCKGGTSLVVQWLRLHAPNAGGSGLIPGQELGPTCHS